MEWLHSVATMTTDRSDLNKNPCAPAHGQARNFGILDGEQLQNTTCGVVAFCYNQSVRSWRAARGGSSMRVVPPQQLAGSATASQPRAEAPVAPCRSPFVGNKQRPARRQQACQPACQAPLRSGQQEQLSRRSRVVARAEASDSSSSSGEVQQLPIFPLSLVALPSAAVPLRIFEAR
jgi:hypothetical protein